MHELLDDEIGRLVMRADHVARREVEALVSRVKAPKVQPAPPSGSPGKTETAS
jgi:hypothetical protein